MPNGQAYAKYRNYQLQMMSNMNGQQWMDGRDMTRKRDEMQNVSTAPSSHLTVDNHEEVDGRKANSYMLVEPYLTPQRINTYQERGKSLGSQPVGTYAAVPGTAQ